ncbi:MAG: DEAD/DEAH box helicase [Atopobiaceae bacterium]
MADSHHNHRDDHRNHHAGRGRRKNYGKKKDFIKKDREKAPKLKEINLTDEELKATPFGMLGLSPTVVKSTIDMGYADPTPVQKQAIPEVLAGHDVMAAAQTGTGKTAAFLLPGLDNLPHTQKGEGPLMLVVTPTRELAQQIEAVANSVCARTGHKAATVVGGVSYNPQRAALKRGCDLLVATPGRLIDLMNQGACSLSQVKLLVLDEADRMLDMGFLPDMQRIVSETPEGRQTLLFSATLDHSVLDHTRDLVNDPVSIEIAHKGTTAETVEQYVLGTEHLAKGALLVQLLQQEGSKRVIVFTNSKHRADTICRKLEKSDIKCAPIHGDRSQAQRMTALRRFAQGDVDVLVATDVLARGIDVPDVSYVVNFDVPFDDPEDYIHRIGRTGRAGEEGWAVTFVTKEDYLNLRAVEQLMGRVIPDFPRAEGLDLGEEPFQPDPNRNPDDKLPSAKVRKRMAKRAGKGGGKRGGKRRDDKRPKAKHEHHKHEAEERRDDAEATEAKPMNRSERRAGMQRNRDLFTQRATKDSKPGRDSRARVQDGEAVSETWNKFQRGSRKRARDIDVDGGFLRDKKRGAKHPGHKDDERDERRDNRRNDRRGGKGGYRSSRRSDWRDDRSSDRHGDRRNDRYGDSRDRYGKSRDSRHSDSRDGNHGGKRGANNVRVVRLSDAYGPKGGKRHSSRHPGDRGGRR